MHADPVTQDLPGLAEVRRAEVGDLLGLATEERRNAPPGRTRVPRQRPAIVPEGQQPRGRLPEMVSDDQVADPPDDDPQWQPDGGRVHRLEESQLVTPHQRVGEDDGPEDPAEQADASPIDGEHVADGLEPRFAEVRDDVEEPRPHDRSDQRPEHHGAGLVLGDATLLGFVDQHVGPGQISDGDAQAVRRDREPGAETETVQDLPADHRDGGEVGHQGVTVPVAPVERTGPTVRGETTDCHRPATPFPMSIPPATSAG